MRIATQPARGRGAASGTRWAALALVVLMSCGVWAFGPPGGAKATFEIATDRTAYDSGDEVRFVVRVMIQDGWHTNSNTPTFDYLIPTEVKLDQPPSWDQAVVSYPVGELKTFAFEDQPLSVYEGQVDLLGTLTVPQSAIAGSNASLGLELIYQACDDKSCAPPVRERAQIEVSIGDGGQATGHPAFMASLAQGGNAVGVPGKEGKSLLVTLLLALVGGLILNAMPCVLPVLSLKLLGLVKSAGQSRAAVVSGAMATTAGILASFVGLALAAIFAKKAGSAVGWGVQFQNPVFVAVLTLIVLLFSLNLWGLFEITLPRLFARAGNAEARGGLGGHFFSGLFATLMATPCSAPFLGSAVGFALSQSSSTILLTFLAIGVGMALPYLLLAATPGAASWIPKPGPWMVSLKSFFGFLLSGAAVWLLYVLSQQVPAETVAFFQVCLLLVALFVWMRQTASSSLARSLAVIGLIGAMASGVVLAHQGRLQGPATTTETQKLIEWQTFDRKKAEQLAASGQLVFVDVTADWCFTCKVNERLILETEFTAEAFKTHNVIAMKADWTNRDDSIGQFLADHGRYGIPFYALYRPSAEPHVFGELLTQQGLKEVIESSAGNRDQRAGAVSEPSEPPPVAGFG